MEKSYSGTPFFQLSIYTTSIHRNLFIEMEEMSF